MDTTLDPQPVWAGKALFYKLQAEAFLQSAGVGFSIIKPCSLSDSPGGEQKLQVGHDDSLMGGQPVSRADVADIMVTAISLRAPGLRFDVCGGSDVYILDLGLSLTISPVWLINMPRRRHAVHHALFGSFSWRPS